MSLGRILDPHLTICETVLPPGTEWTTQMPGWQFLQAREGISYCRRNRETLELPPGSTLVFTGDAPVTLFASQLGEARLAGFRLEPGRLTGLLSLAEQRSLTGAASRQELSLRVLPADDALSERFRTLCDGPKAPGLSLRLQLLELFIDLFKCELEREQLDLPRPLDGRQRLRQFLRQTAAAEFLNLSVADLAPRMSCSPRHLSRLFREEVGASLRQKQTELRLAKACELLATSNAKVVDVALTSGYPSNSLFSLVFKRHFGVSPGKWRQLQVSTGRRRQKSLRALPV